MTDPAILTELTNRVQAEVPILPERLRGWFETHRALPREIAAASDPEGTRTIRVWLVTDHTGVDDGSSRVVYDAESKAFGLVVTTQNGVLWYMGPYGSLVDTVESI